MNPIGKEAGDTPGANPSSADGLTIDAVQKLLAEKQELPPGSSLTPSGGPVPSGSEVNSDGFIEPGDELIRERLKEQVAKFKDGLKSARARLTKTEKLLQLEVDSAGSDKQKVANRAASVAEQEAVIKEMEALLKDAEAELRALPPEVIPDDQQPWFGRIYANCNGYLVKDADGNFKHTNETNTGRFLREMGISDRRDTETSSPLDRAYTALHDRHHVDHWGPLAGYRPGIIQHGGKKVLITKGAELIKEVKGEFPTIQEFIDGMLQEQAIYAHCWNHLAVVPLYNGEITTGQVLVLAGPIDSGKSVYQKLLVTPLLGGRAAKPYAYMIKRTDFNEDLFESEHLMCEDETPARDFETKLLFASELKKLAADENHWCQGKGKKALTLPPYWRVTVSVNDHPDYLPAIPANDETLKDKMLILKVYPDVTVKLVEKVGGKKAFADKILEELPAYLYWLLHEFQIPEELRETRFGVRAFQHPEIVEAIEETAPYMQVLDHMEHAWAGVCHEDISLTEFASLLEMSNPPKGVLPNNVNTLAKYLTSLSKVTKKITKDRTKKGVFYTADFREDVDRGHRNGKPTKNHEKQREEARKARQEEEKWEYGKLLEMLRPEDREAIRKAHIEGSRHSTMPLPLPSGFPTPAS
jgi:hypothetical protein